MDIYEKLKELKLSLPDAPAKGGVYTPCMPFGTNLEYISGCGPVIGNEKPVGKLGQVYTTEEGKHWAQNAMLNVLSVLEARIGNLNKVVKPIKILVFVASDDNFTEQPMVANGASELLAELFGEDNVPARSAIGVNVLPGNIPVEIEAIFEVRD